MTAPFASRPYLVVARRRGGALAAIVHPGSKSRPARITAVVRADAAGPALAVAAVVAKLRLAGRRIPSRAVVLAPDVETRLIELPANPLKPPAHAESSEMIRWEIEPYLPAQTGREDDGVVAAWCPAAGDDGPQWTWQVAGARHAALDEWRAALAGAGTRLVAAYALAGCGPAAAPPDAPSWFVVEERVDQLVVRIVVENDVVVSRTSRTGAADSDVVDSAPRLVVGDGDDAGSLAPFVDVADGVEASAKELAPLAGAARHAARVVPRTLCVGVSPSSRRVASRLVAAACGVVVVAASIAAMERTIDRRRELLDRIQSATRDANAADAVRAALEREKSELEKQSKPSSGGTARTTSAAALLDVVASHVRPGFVLDRVRFERTDGVTIDGRGPDPAESSAFRDALTSGLAPAGFSPLNSTIEAASGSTTASTFHFRFRVAAAEATR